MVEFKSSTLPQMGLAKSPSMMVSTIHTLKSDDQKLKRSLSVPGEEDEIMIKTKDDNAINNRIDKMRQNEKLGSRVTIPRADDDETFNKFFVKTKKNSVIDEGVEISDFDAIKSNERLLEF